MGETKSIDWVKGVPPAGSVDGWYLIDWGHKIPALMFVSPRMIFSEPDRHTGRLLPVGEALDGAHSRPVHSGHGSATDIARGLSKLCRHWFTGESRDFSDDPREVYKLLASLPVYAKLLPQPGLNPAERALQGAYFG